MLMWQVVIGAWVTSLRATTVDVGYVPNAKY